MAAALISNPNRPDAHSIAEGALFADLTILVALIGLYVPYAGPAMAAISPIPLLLLALRRGWRVTTEATLVCCLLVAFLAGPFSAFPVVLIALRSAALGVGLRRGWRARNTILAGTTGLWIVACTGVAFTAAVLPSWRTATEQGIAVTYKELVGILGVFLRVFGQTHLWNVLHPSLNDFLAWFLSHWLLLLPLAAWPVLAVAVTAEYVIAEVVLPRFGFTPLPLRLFGMNAISAPAAAPRDGLRARLRRHLEAELVVRQAQLNERRSQQRGRGGKPSLETVLGRSDGAQPALPGSQPPDGGGD